MDITDEKNIYEILKESKVKFCINTAAYTAVDQCELDPVQCKKVNELAVGYLARACLKLDIQLIHISTDYVFDGRSTYPYPENHTTNPINQYGKSKRLGEKLALSIHSRKTLILRTSWLYGRHGKNFLTTMLKLAEKQIPLKIVDDQIGSPTFTLHLARAILEIIVWSLKNKKDVKGIYHFSNEGQTSWFHFAREIFKLKNLEVDVTPVLTETYSTPATRPKFSVLSKEKIKKDFNLKIETWQKRPKRMC